MTSIWRTWVTWKTQTPGVVTPAPTVTGVSPNTGTSAGGTGVTITGTHFTGATAVTFGGTGVAFTVVDDSHITAASPAHAGGVVDVQVTTPGGTSGISPSDQFTYFDPILPIGTVANVQDVSATTSITMVEPTGVQTGDLLIACVGILTGSPVLTPPGDDWIQIDTQNVQTNQINACYYRYVKNTDVPGTTSWVWSGAPSLPRMQGVIAAFRFVDPVNPIHAHAVNQNGGTANTNVGYPSLAAVANDFVIGFALARPSTAGIQTVFTPAAGWTEPVNACTNSGTVGNLAVEMIEQVQLSSGTIAAFNSTVDQASNWATYLVALKPA